MDSVGAYYLFPGWPDHSLNTRMKSSSSVSKSYGNTLRTGSNRSKKKNMPWPKRCATHFAAPSFYLEGISETEIGLYEVFHRRIEVIIPTPDPVIAGLAKDSDMGSKPILESTADVREPAIVGYVR